jgi:hypothetical protein
MKECNRMLQYNILVRNHEKFIEVYFKYTKKAKVSITDLSLNTQDFSYVSLPTKCITYPKTCFIQKIPSVLPRKTFKGIMQTERGPHHPRTSI